MSAKKFTMVAVSFIAFASGAAFAQGVPGTGKITNSKARVTNNKSTGTVSVEGAGGVVGDFLGLKGGAANVNTINIGAEVSNGSNLLVDDNKSGDVTVGTGGTANVNSINAHGAVNNSTLTVQGNESAKVVAKQGMANVNSINIK